MSTMDNEPAIAVLHALSIRIIIAMDIVEELSRQYDIDNMLRHTISAQDKVEITLQIAETYSSLMKLYTLLTKIKRNLF